MHESPSSDGVPSSSDDSRTQFDSVHIPSPGGCPTDEQIASFLDESLPEADRDLLVAHIDGCMACQTLLDLLTTDAGGAVARIRENSSVMDSVRREAGDRSRASGDMTASEASTTRSGFAGLPRIPGFVVIEPIGQGGMGIVYRARHSRLNRFVALKTILAGIHADPRMVQRFFFEAEVMARVRHPQVVEVFEANQYKGPDGLPVPYLAMEFLEGGTLRHRLRDGPRPAAEAAALIEGVARAVHAAHLQGVVHRDLKPGNILFGKSSGNELPKVGDFGLAKLLTPRDADLTASGQVVGTPSYMAPEQASGDGPFGPETDVYALGTILFEMLVGHPPFQGRESMKVLTRVMQEPAPSVASLRPDLPRDLAAVTMKCLEKSPSLRYRSAEALADDLRRFQENRPTLARPISRLEHGWRWAKRNPAVSGLLATLATVLLVGMVSVIVLWQQAERTARDERQAKDAAVIAEKTAADALQIADARQARLEFDRGVALCEDGQVETGLSHFRRALELAEATGTTDLARVASINLAAWPKRVSHTLRTITEPARVRGLAMSRDGKWFVAVSGSRLVVNEADTGREVRSLAATMVPPFREPPTLLCAAIDTKGRIAAGADNGWVYVWDSGKERPRRFPTGGSAVHSLAFAPDGTLWVADGRPGAQSWNLNEETPAAEAVGRMFRSPVDVLTLNTQGTRVYLGTHEFLFEWDTVNRRVASAWPVADTVTSIALNRDETSLAFTGASGLCRVVDLRTGRIDHDISLNGAAGTAVAFSASGDTLFIGEGDGNVRLLDRATALPVGVPLNFLGSVTALLLRPETDEFAVAAGNTVSVCQAVRPAWQVLQSGEGRVRSLAYDATGTSIVVAAGWAVNQYNVNGVRTKSHRLEDEPLVVRFNSSQSRILCGGKEGLIAIPFDNLPQPVPNSVQGAPYSAISLLDEARLATAGPQGVTLWNASLTGEMFHPLRDGVQALAVRKNGRDMLLGTERDLVVVDPSTWAPVIVKSFPARIADVCESADGQHVLVGLQNSSAVLLDAMTWKEQLPPLEHGRAVTGVAIAPDGKTLLTGSRDGTARFWDAVTGLPLGPILRHPGPVTTVAFSPTGTSATTGTANGHVLSWPKP